MTEETFESYFQRYEMGQAYKTITTQMGPSPQLVAFVNYDKITDASLGLESFDIMSQHEQIINEIDTNSFYEMATESLATKVRKISDYVLKGGAIVWLFAFIGGPFGNIGFAAMLGGAIVKKIAGLPTQVFSLAQFKALQNLIGKVLEIEIQYTNQIPTTFTETAWKDFDKNFSKIKPIIYTESHRKVPVDKSGWTEETIVSSAKWLKDTAEKIADLQKTFGKRLEAIDTWVKEDHKGDKEASMVLKYISSSLGLTFSSFRQSTELLGNARLVLNDAAHMFEESKT